jgi:hypothetical protein
MRRNGCAAHLEKMTHAELEAFGHAFAPNEVFALGDRGAPVAETELDSAGLRVGDPDLLRAGLEGYPVLVTHFGARVAGRKYFAGGCGRELDP